MPREISTTEFEYDHRVTSTNTAMHWILYALDAWESKDEQHREHGATPDNVWDEASDSNDESIVFRNVSEVRHQMKQLATDRDGLDRRTNETKWSGLDVDYRYRLSDHGRKALLDLGIPEYLPNRRDPEHDRQLPMEPTHEPGWWLDTDDQPDWEIEEGWSIDGHDWLQTNYDRVFYKDEADKWGRGELEIVEDLSNAFPEAMFVITMGPHRFHDLAYCLRDPFNKVVQIDVYSPVFLSRTGNEIRVTVQDLVKELHEALESAEEEWGDDD